GDMHRCAAKCCDDPQTSLERVHGCIDNCTTSLNQANEYVQGEINHFQNRLQRCVMDCNDAARDKLGANPSQETVSFNYIIIIPTCFFYSLAKFECYH
ncbi:Protein FAM136A, partial [Papilio machaon]